MYNSNAPKPSIVVWTDLSEDQTKQLVEMNESESINKFFVKTFHLEPNTKRTMILCDLYYYALNFARTNKFNNEQISTFISILKRVHETCIQTPFANMEETYKYFKMLVLKHSLFRPPVGLRIFTPDVTKKVVDYTIDTYFRHYKMYKYIFTPTIDFHLKFSYEGMKQDSQAMGETDQQDASTKETDTNVMQSSEDKNNQQQEIDEHNAQLVEVRKFIQTFVKDEIQKLHSTRDDNSMLRPPTEKHRSAKSSSTKTSKSQSPK